MEQYFQKKLPELPVDVLRLRLDETLKFLNIATYCDGPIPVTADIDEIWHLWILETQEYARLCERLQGRQFLHHTSNAYLSCVEESDDYLERKVDVQVEILGTYYLNYGEFSAEAVPYWCFANHLVDDCGWTVGQLNEWLGAGVAEARGQALPVRA
jgi:hypothetical protein